MLKLILDSCLNPFAFFFHKCFGYFVCYCVSWAQSECDTEEKFFFGFDSGKKCEFQIEWGGLFHDINHKNNGAIVIPRFSTTYVIYVDKCAQVLVTYLHKWKIYITVTLFGLIVCTIMTKMSLLDLVICISDCTVLRSYFYN